ncbi:hypothetical protein SteCoe_19315 [Stentor coeruleus]|uniref:Homeobox domain-containing protein n=1 Tax=Stentor coeruleus TaxID=5963 RepID=A0A1R2BUD1_9CILI|nr:hypothetical protein SteCoe_19315 [Stentor coeruleus]
MKTRSKTGALKTILKTVYYSSDESQDSNISPDFDHPCSKTDRKRFRKNELQVKVLIQEFDKNPFWSKKLVLELSDKTGLSESQVYKWNWDYRKKIRKSEKQPNENKLACKETLIPSKMEGEIIQLQKYYKVSFNTVPMTTPSRFLFSGV